MRAVILAGGQGSRLRPWTANIPKALVPINKAPLAGYIISSLADAGFKNIVFLAGYRSAALYKFKQFIDDRQLFEGVEVEIHGGSASWETGFRVFEYLRDNIGACFLFYCDNWFPILNSELQPLIAEKSGVVCSVFRNSDGTAEYGYENNVKFDSNKKVVEIGAFDSRCEEYTGIDVGMFFLSANFCRDILTTDMTVNTALQQVVFSPTNLFRGNCTVNILDRQYHWVTDPKSRIRFEEFMLAENSGLAELMEDSFEGFFDQFV